MPQIIEQGDIFGRIGKGIGQGVSEQAERSMLSKGIEKIASDSSLTPAQQAARFHALPGGAQAYPAIQPFLRQAGEIQEARDAQVNKPISEGNGQANQIVAEQGQKAPPNALRRLTNTPEAIRAGGLSYVTRFPNRYRNIAEGEAQYQKDYDKQQSNIDYVDKRLSDVASTKLQSGKGTYSDILGELQTEFQKRAEDAVISGKMSETEAGDYYSKQMLDFAKARSRQKEMKTDYWNALVSDHPQRALKAARESYKEADMPEAFMNDLISYQKFSLPRASSIAFPTSKEDQNYFDNLKFSKGVFGDDKKVFDEALKRLSPKDSLQNFALQLQKKGYEPTEFLKYAQDSGKSFEPFQTREFQNIGNFQPSVSDIIYYTLLGKGG